MIAIVCALFLVICYGVEGWIFTSSSKSRTYGSITGERFNSVAVSSTMTVDPVTSFKYMGDMPANYDDFDIEKSQYNLNVGKSLEVIRRQLPMVFAVSDLDFSIFAEQVQVVDENQHKILMPKNIYSAAVKSLRMAAAFSSMYPSMNVKKIEYISEEKTIQCLVDVVLPDSVRIKTGQAVWEGMFYFGLDSQGLIVSHVFDRTIRTKTPLKINANSYPWLRAGASWTSDLLSGSHAPQPGRLVSAINIDEVVLEILSCSKV